MRLCAPGVAPLGTIFEPIASTSRACAAFSSWNLLRSAVSVAAMACACSAAATTCGQLAASHAMPSVPPEACRNFLREVPDDSMRNPPASSCLE